MTEQLKPCPFCGEPAELFRVMLKWRVQCTKAIDGCGMETSFFLDKERAIAAWNRRAE
jgi:Lar family restriction alleviation protein